MFTRLCSRFPAAILLALLLAGCVRAPATQLPTDTPPTATIPVHELSEAELAAAEALWESQNIDHYRIEILDVRSIWHAQTNVVIVQDGVAADAGASCIPAPMEGGECAVQPFDPDQYTIPALFDTTRKQFAGDQALWTHIRFDETYGYPAEISFDDPEILDEDWGLRVTSFEVLPAPTAETETPQPTATPVPVVERNSDWTPVVAEFEGVEMVLVPPGCFLLGSDSEEADDDEQPVNEQCFDAPFWIDRTEVANAAFGSEGLFDGGERPRDSVRLAEVVSFCAERGSRLPTEAEWEYAARGPSNREYPWGNEFNADLVVFAGSSRQQSAAVGSRPDGASWVGALDMVGNLWEWTSTIYAPNEYPYPYQADDGREDSADLTSPRVIRGGSWSNGDVWMRASVRKGKHPSADWYGYVGFRCARDGSP